MQIDTLEYLNESWNYTNEAVTSKSGVQFVCVFGDTEVFKQSQHCHALREIYPGAHILGCSSSGHVVGSEISQAALIAAAVYFEHSTVKLNYFDFKDADDIEELSKKMVQKFQAEDLKHIFILSNGLLVNGSALVKGVNNGSVAAVSGGMAGDGDRFQETWIIADDEPRQRRVAAIGFFGDSLKISSGSFAGWSEFGPDRIITRSDGNVLYELDNQPALDLYKHYLGDYAPDLPNSGLRFPLSIRENDNDLEVIRTLLGIDEEQKSITFAGDVPEGYTARLMKPDQEVLVEGAGKAAGMIVQGNKKQAIALVVSCVGRKIVMNQLVEEELEEVQSVLGDNVQLCGFYSYGEIAPSATSQLFCDLHNQTMTLTTIYED